MSQDWQLERVTLVADALELEWYAGDTIVAYVLSSMSPEILQIWSDTALDVLAHWPVGKPYLALYDLSHRGVVMDYLGLVQKKMFSLGVTEAGEERALASIAERDDFSARIAMYTSIRHTGHIGRLFARIDALRELYNQFVQYDVFYRREAALDWLNQHS
jgi:hypothetical protein